MKTKLISIVGLCLMAILTLNGCSKDDSQENPVKVTVSGTSFTFDDKYELEIPFLVSPSDYDASSAVLVYSDFHFDVSGSLESSLSMPSVATSVKRDTSADGKWIMSCKLKDGITGKDFAPGDSEFSYSATVSLRINDVNYGSFGISASKK
ncbi:MAG: hypothetical protein PARBA_02086 [Parabacteroides sp.]|jgi:hypothetical protein